MKTYKKLVSIFALAVSFSASAQIAPNNTPVSSSLIDEYNQYIKKNPLGVYPGSAIDEKDLEPARKKTIPLQISISKDEKQIVLSQLEIPNSVYTKVFYGSSFLTDKKDTEGRKISDGNGLQGEKSEADNQLDMLEIGIIVNVKNNSNQAISQVWFDRDNQNMKTSKSIIKADKGGVVSGSIDAEPRNIKDINEVSIRHKIGSNATTYWNGYKIELKNF